MPITIDPATPERLERAVLENLIALFRSMADLLPGAELDESPVLGRHHAWPTNPMFKGAWAACLEASSVDAAIDDTIGWFRARRAPYFFWWTGPGTTPLNLGDRLRERGFLDMAEQQHALAAGIQQTELGAPCMVADLETMNTAVLEQTPANFRIVEVVDDAGLEDFKRVFVETYQIPEFAGQAWLDATRAVGLARSPWRIHVGYLDDVPVATNIVFCGAGVASVYGIATHPSVQRRGLGAAMTLRPLLETRNAGYRSAVLFSTEMGVRVYERIGFQKTGARINRYLWRAAAQ